MAHPFSLLCLGVAAICYQFRREIRAAKSVPKRPSAIATEQGISDLDGSQVRICRGWALAHAGTGCRKGSAQMRQGLAAFHATGRRV